MILDNNITKLNVSKDQALEYILEQFLQWYTAEGENTSYGLSKLKLIQLHFFLCSTSRPLLTIFNKFVAKKFGPAELDCLELIKEGTFSSMKIHDHHLILKEGAPPVEIDQSAKDIIDEAMTTLKRQNPRIIHLSAIDLMITTNRWRCWANAYKGETTEGQQSPSITINQILNEPLKYYGVSTI
ncbi:MAG: hypothetical protein ISR65_20235 [Bacteriovoracaceae bacterium]|nr:hypothetical protein [Bacteriovoracaceae bacterium]